MGIVPLWGLQMLIAYAVSHLLKLNKALVIVAANISIPPMLPFILYGSYVLGALVFQKPITLKLDSSLSLSSVNQFFAMYLVGAVALALISGLVAYSVAYLVLSNLKKRNKLNV